MAKLVAFLSTACLICLLVAIIVYQHLHAPGGGSARFDSAAIIQQVRPLNELVTVKYGIEKVVSMTEQKSPVGSESILLLVQGQVLAGVDLAELKPDDVTVSNQNEVRIRLSPPHIQEAFIVEKNTKVWDRTVTWWTPWVTPDIDLEHKARLQAVADIKTDALNMGILAQAQRNAEADIRSILAAFGIQRIHFYYST
jgi:hypothetical protein